MLDQILNTNLIQFKDQLETWEEAIQLAAAPLLDNGSIEQTYVDKIISNTNEIGPYYVLGPNIALPHARPEFGVKQMGLSILVMNEPVWFSDKEHHKVQLIIVLAAVDNQSHLGALSELAAVLGDETNVNKLIHSKSEEEFLNQLLTSIH
jgi:mannitol operon transcriptional antiterminator